MTGSSSRTSSSDRTASAGLAFPPSPVVIFTRAGDRGGTRDETWRFGWTRTARHPWGDSPAAACSGGRLVADYVGFGTCAPRGWPHPSPRRDRRRGSCRHLREERSRLPDLSLPFLACGRGGRSGEFSKLPPEERPGSSQNAEPRTSCFVTDSLGTDLWRRSPTCRSTPFVMIRYGSPAAREPLDLSLPRAQ